MKGDSFYQKKHTAQEVVRDTNSFRFQKVFLYQNSDMLERASKPKSHKIQVLLKTTPDFNLSRKVL